MKRSTKLAMAFAAVAVTAATGAMASDRNGGGKGQMRFERADADSSGDISFEEFSAAMKGRFETADSDGDGKVTMAEIASAIEKTRAERMAKRMMARFDTNGDGVLTAAEVEGRQQKIFAYLDRNEDGKIEKSEMPRRGGWGKKQ